MRHSSEAREGEIGEAQNGLIDTATDEYSDDLTPKTRLTLFFDEKGDPAEDGVYQVDLFMTCEVRSVGYMITGNMGIVHVDSPEEELAQLDTAVYFPDAVDAVLSSDVEIDFGEISEIETETESDVSAQTEAES